MRTQNVVVSDFQGVFAVPPVARVAAERHAINVEESQRIADHILTGGISRLLYGGNAFLYHVTLKEYEALLDWLVSFPDTAWCIPSAGPSFGRAMDQAPLLRKRSFPMVMALPCHDPRPVMIRGMLPDSKPDFASFPKRQKRLSYFIAKKKIVSATISMQGLTPSVAWSTAVLASQSSTLLFVVIRPRIGISPSC